MKIKKLGNVETAFTIFKAFVGLGVLQLPAQFYATGKYTQPSLMIGSLFLSLYCVSLLLEVADSVASSFPAIAKETFGNWLKIVVDILIFFSQFGFCVNYVYFIQTQGNQVINCISNSNDTQCAFYAEPPVPYLYFLPILLCVYLPLVWIRKTEKLAFTHIISDVLIAVTLITVCIYAGSNISANGLVFSQAKGITS